MSHLGNYAIAQTDKESIPKGGDLLRTRSVRFIAQPCRLGLWEFDDVAAGCGWGRLHGLINAVSNSWLWYAGFRTRTVR